MATEDYSLYQVVVSGTVVGANDDLTRHSNLGDYALIYKIRVQLEAQESI